MQEGSLIYFAFCSRWIRLYYKLQPFLFSLSHLVPGVYTTSGHLNRAVRPAKGRARLNIHYVSDGG